MPGARCARSLACEIKKAHEYSHHGHAGNRPAFPAQWFYGLLRALPGVRILGCHRHWRIKVCQSPVGLTRLRKFSTSNGCQDHTALPSALAPFVWVPFVSSRAVSTRPAIPWHRLTLPRPPHPIPTFVTMANAPARGRDGGSSRFDLG